MDVSVVDTDGQAWRAHDRYSGVYVRRATNPGVSADVEVRVLRLDPGAEIASHIHAGSAETIYIVKGDALLLLSGGEQRCSAGSCIHAPAAQIHALRNAGTGDLEIIAIFTPALPGR